MHDANTPNDGELTPEQGGAGNQKNKSRFAFPEPSLWNSEVGRRAFLKKTGVASAASVVALHGFRTEALAQASDCLRVAQNFTHIGSKTGTGATYATAKGNATAAMNADPRSPGVTFTVLCSTATGRHNYSAPLISYSPATDPGGSGPFSVTVVYSENYYEVGACQ